MVSVVPKLSIDKNHYGAELMKLQTILNGLADTDVKSLVGKTAPIGAGSTIAVSSANRTIYLDTLTGSVATLPAATGSLQSWKFVLTVVPTSNSHKVQVASASDFMIGSLPGVSDDPATVKGWIAANSGTVATNSDTITLNRSTSGGVSVGEWIEVQDVAPNTWLVSGMITQTGTEVTPFSAAV